LRKDNFTLATLSEQVSATGVTTLNGAIGGIQTIEANFGPVSGLPRFEVEIADDFFAVGARCEKNHALGLGEAITRICDPKNEPSTDTGNPAVAPVLGHREFVDANMRLQRHSARQARPCRDEAKNPDANKDCAPSTDHWETLLNRPSFVTRHHLHTTRQGLPRLRHICPGVQILTMGKQAAHRIENGTHIASKTARVGYFLFDRWK
jgi:hypothetical protein